MFSDEHSAFGVTRLFKRNFFIIQALFPWYPPLSRQLIECCLRAFPAYKSVQLARQLREWGSVCKPETCFSPETHLMVEKENPLHRALWPLCVRGWMRVLTNAFTSSMTIDFLEGVCITQPHWNCIITTFYNFYWPLVPYQCINHLSYLYCDRSKMVKTWEGLSMRQAQGCCWYARCPRSESRGLRCQKLWDCSTLSRWATLDASGEPAHIHGNASQDLLWVSRLCCVCPSVVCSLLHSTRVYLPFHILCPCAAFRHGSHAYVGDGK